MLTGVVLFSESVFQKGALIKLNSRVSQKTTSEKQSATKQPVLPAFFQLNPNASLPEKNTEVASLVQLYSRQKNEYSKLETSLKQRREKVATLIRENPTEANRNVLKSDVINAFPLELRHYVEVPKSIEGVLQTGHFDNFSMQENNFSHFLFTSDKKIVPIYSAKNLIDYSGQSINASGVFLDGVGIATNNISPVSKAAYIKKNTSRLLVIPLAFYGADPNNLNLPPPQTVPQLDLRKTIFDGQDSVKEFFKKNSGGTINFTGDILQSPLALGNSKFARFPIVQFFSYDDFHALMKEVDSQIDFSKYDYFQFIPLNERITSISRCAGLGSQGSMIFDTDEGTITVGISIINLNCLYFSQQTFKHEIGHNLALNHANGWGCTPDDFTSQFYAGLRKDIPLDPDPDSKTTQSCITVYGDDSVMGGGVIDLNPAQRKKIGDIFSSKTIVENGIYSLDVSINEQVGNFAKNIQNFSNTETFLQDNYQDHPETFLIDKPTISKENNESDFTKGIILPNTKNKLHYKELIIPAVNGYYSLEYRLMGTKKGIVIWFVRNDTDSWPYTERLLSDTLRIGGGNYDKNYKKILDSFFGINASFEDALRGINVSILDLDNSTATVQVSIN